MSKITYSDPDPEFEIIHQVTCVCCTVTEQFEGTKEDFLKEITLSGYKQVENDHCVFSLVCPHCVVQITDECTL
jgi:hypothetical protein